MKTHDFPVELQSIFLTGEKEIPKRKAIVRTDTNQTLGIASSSYALLPHANVVNGFREALTGYKITEQIQVTKNGAHLYYRVGLPEVVVKVSEEDSVSLMLFVKNSYDGSHSLQILFGAFRLVCSNGMVIGRKFVEFNHKHVGENMTVKVGALQSQIARYIDLFFETTPVMKKMVDTTAVIEKEVSFSGKVIGIPQYLLDEAHREYDRASDSSVWGYYNSITYAITHKMKKESPALAIKYGKIAWEQALTQANV